MAELFPPQGGPANILSGYYDMKNVEQAAAQQAMKSQLMNLDIAREQAAQQEQQAGAPLRAEQRALQMGQVQGQRQQLPFIQERELALARAAADPQRLLQDVESGNLDSEAKVRAGKMKKTADEMDLHIQGFEPVLSATKAGNYEAQNSAWDSYFDLLDKNGIDTREMRVTPRNQLLPGLTQKYQEALNTAPTIRERIKADQAHKRRLEEIAAQERDRVAAARERAAAERPVNSPNAVVSRIMDKYRKDPTTLNNTERDTLRDWYENNLTGADQTDYEFAWSQPERDAIRRRHAARIRRMYPDLYREIPNVKPGPEVQGRLKFDAKGNPIK